jgi:hypothetical protein
MFLASTVFICLLSCRVCTVVPGGFVELSRAWKRLTRETWELLCFFSGMGFLFIHAAS